MIGQHRPGARKGLARAAGLINAIRRRNPIGRTRRITIVGHSHIWSMRDALRDARRPIEVIDFWNHSNPFGGDEIEHLDRILGPRVAGPIVSVIGGSRQDFISLYAHPRTFDVVLPNAADLPLFDGAEIVPIEAVRQTLLSFAEPSMALIGAVKARAGGPMFHVDSPPPWGDERNVADWAYGFKDPPSDRFSPRWLRLKMWRLHSALMRDFCTTLGVGFIEVPPSAFDAEGFLRTELSGDLVHGNQAYGALMLEAVLRAVRA